MAHSAIRAIPSTARPSPALQKFQRGSHQHRSIRWVLQYAGATQQLQLHDLQGPKVPEGLHQAISLNLYSRYISWVLYSCAWYVNPYPKDLQRFGVFLLSYLLAYVKQFYACGLLSGIPGIQWNLFGVLRSKQDDSTIGLLHNWINH